MDERLVISSLSNIPIHGENNKLCLVQDTYQQKLLMTYIINKSFLNNVNTCELFFLQMMLSMVMSLYFLKNP
ncbi:hypothetical protein BIW67_02165 [Salmonella enterica]|nr:hypothetical protein [Salmonella enterica]EAS2241747.1 hypothetical protein [Salmonella enterica]